MREPDRGALANPGRWLWGILGLAVVVRVVAALYLGNTVAPLPGTADQLSYHALALRVLEGHGFSFGTGWWPATPAGQPTAHWSYLYVLFLAGTYALAGPSPLVARLVQAVAVGILLPLLTYRVALRLFGRRVGLVAAALSATYAYFVYYAAALMTESLFIVAVLWSMDLAMELGASARAAEGSTGRRHWLTLGAGLGIAILLRQAVAVCVPVVLAWVAWRLRVRVEKPLLASRASRGSLLGGSVLSLLVIAACILPWTVRNYRAFHQFVPLNTNAGFAFYWGNHPIHGTAFVPILPGDGSLYGRLIPHDLAALNEAEMDRALLQRGIRFVAEDPVRYLLLSLSRGKEYLRFWPAREASGPANWARALSFGLCLPLMLAGILLSLRRSPALPSSERLPARAGTWLMLSVVAVYSLTHLLTWTLVRYRLPIDALLMPFAALALVRSFDVVVEYNSPGESR